MIVTPAQGGFSSICALTSDAEFAAKHNQIAASGRRSCVLDATTVSFYYSRAHVLRNMLDFTSVETRLARPFFRNFKWQRNLNER